MQQKGTYMDAAYVKCSLAVVPMLAMSSVVDGARISGQVISVDSGKPLPAANVMVSNPAEKLGRWYSSRRAHKHRTRVLASLARAPVAGSCMDACVSSHGALAS